MLAGLGTGSTENEGRKEYIRLDFGIDYLAPNKTPPSISHLQPHCWVKITFSSESSSALIKQSIKAGVIAHAPDLSPGLSPPGIFQFTASLLYLSITQSRLMSAKDWSAWVLFLISIPTRPESTPGFSFSVRQIGQWLMGYNNVMQRGAKRGHVCAITFSAHHHFRMAIA